MTAKQGDMLCTLLQRLSSCRKMRRQQQTTTRTAMHTMVGLLQAYQPAPGFPVWFGSAGVL